MESQIKLYFNLHCEKEEMRKLKFDGLKILEENFRKFMFGLDPASAKTLNFICLVYGSTRMENGTEGSDVDLCFVAPVFVNSENFANIFLTFLQFDSRVENVKDLMHAPVPKLEAKINGIKFEILLARSGLPSIPKDLDLLQDSTMEKLQLDENGVRAINGFRNCELIMSKVSDLAVFREVCIVLKDWAKGETHSFKFIDLICGCPLISLTNAFFTFSKWDLRIQKVERNSHLHIVDKSGNGQSIRVFQIINHLGLDIAVDNL